MAERNPARGAVALLVLAFCGAYTVVDPRGNFPLDDDWDFALTTWTFLRTGAIEYTPFTSATAHLQVLWGALWSAIFGETFNVLRASILTLSLASTLLVFAILRRAGATAAVALFGAASLLFDPLFFWASATYMTHVPFVFASLVALALFAVAVEKGGVWLLAAAVAAVASCFTRQFGALNVVTPLILALAFRGRLSAHWKRMAVAYGGASVLYVALIAGTGTLIASRDELASVHTPFGGALDVRLLLASHHLFFNWQFAALFFAPALLLVLLSRRRPAVSWPLAGAVSIGFGLVAARMIRIGLPLPYRGGHVFVDFGLGPHTLRDVAILRMRYPHHLPEVWRMVLTLASTVLAVAAVAVVVRVLRANDEEQSRREVLSRFAAVYVLCGAVAVTVMRVFFDRYTIDTAWPLAILLPLLVWRYPPGRAAWTVAIAAMSVMALFAVSATAEYLAWNRARWEAYGFLRAHGVTLEQMDGGYEVNAFLAVRAGRSNLGKPGFGVVDDRFILAFNEVPGYATIRTFEYARWLGLRRGVVRVLRRQ